VRVTWRQSQEVCKLQIVEEAIKNVAFALSQKGVIFLQSQAGGSIQRITSIRGIFHTIYKQRV
jgi:hypothetical protein